jgi:hypothetical protein
MFAEAVARKPRSMEIVHEREKNGYAEAGS